MATIKRPRGLPLIGAGIAAVVAVLIGGLALSYWFLPRALVTLYLIPKTISQTLQITIDPNRETDLAKKRLAGEVMELEVEDSLEKATTGESEVGEKATGEITVFNKTSSSKKLAAGTVVIGPNQLQFSLDKDITIASQSATDTGITFGKTTTSVTAGQVGTSSNLPADTPLTIKGFDSATYSAKTNKTLSGGSSKQVRSVSKDDQDALLEELRNKLTSEALEKLKTSTNSNETIIDQKVATEIIGKKFTKAVGEEADIISLTAKIRIKTLKFKTSDLIELAKKESTGTESGRDFIAVNDKVDIVFENVEFEDEVAAITTTLNTQLIPKLDPDEIIGNLQGKYPVETENYLKSLPEFSKVEIEFSPKLPQPLATFPKREKNITLKIKVIQ